MERKARENLEAARVLLTQEDPCTNAATSRAYYAAYQACWSAMNDAGRAAPEVRPGVVYFPHSDLPGEAVAAGILTNEQASDLETLAILRSWADYGADDITLEQAAWSVSVAEGLVGFLVGASI